MRKMAIIIFHQVTARLTIWWFTLCATKLKLDEYNTSVTMTWQGFKIGNDSLDIASSATQIGMPGVQALGSFGTNAVEKERTYDPK